jgi:hypothetical protein
VASWKGELEVPALDVRRLPTLVPALLQRLRSLRFDDGLLVDPRTGAALDTLRDTTGSHPLQGTTYSGWYHSVADPGDDDPEPVWRQWDMTVEADDADRVAFRVVDAPGSDDVARMSLEIPQPSRPMGAVLEVVLDTGSAGSLKGDVTIRIDASWAEPMVTVAIVHRKFRAAIVAEVDVLDDTWLVHLDAALTGRGLRRPLFGIAMVVLRRPIVRVLEREIARVPDAFTGLVDDLAAHPDDGELAALLVDEWLDHVRS